MLALAALLLLVLLAGIAFVKFSGSSTKPQTNKTTNAASQDEEEEDANVAGVRRGGAADRMRAGRLRQRQAANRAAAAAAAQQAAAQVNASASEGSGSEYDEDEDGEEAQGNGRQGRNKKGRARDARREAREAEQAMREAREGKRSAYEERRRKKDEEREAREAAQEEEMQAAREAAQKQEDEEAAKWMSMISVEKEGTGEAENSEENQGLLSQFIDYIKSRKMVPLEQIAIEFRLRTTDVIDRINGLEAMGRLTGVMDERGKYIYISPEEMQTVTDFIKTRGRIAISELANKSSTLIDLEPKAATATALPGKAMDFDALLGADAAAPAVETTA